MNKVLIYIFILFNPALTFSQSPKLAILVDERVELITTMQLLFGYPLVGKADINYKKELIKRFSKYENDTSVLYFLDIAQKGFSFSKPFTYTYHFSFPKFKQITDFTDYESQLLDLGKNGASLNRFNTALKRFYKQSNFHNFYKKQRPFYRKLIENVRKTVDSTQLITLLENHYGIKQQSYNLILSPLFIEAGMSIWVETPKGKNLYSIIGPNIDSKDEPNFDTRWLMQQLAFHEFSHPFCNPLIDKYYTALEKDSCLFEPIKKALLQQSCGDWKAALYEFLTRANEIVLVEKAFGKTDAEAVYQNYLNQKWIYLKGLVPILKEYDKNRHQYKTIEGIMPKVIDFFDKEAKLCSKYEL